MEQWQLLIRGWASSRSNSCSLWAVSYPSMLESRYIGYLKTCALVICAEETSCFSGKRGKLGWKNMATSTWQRRSWLRSRLARRRNFRDWQTNEKPRSSAVSSRFWEEYIRNYKPTYWLAWHTEGLNLVLWTPCCDSWSFGDMSNAHWAFWMACFQETSFLNNIVHDWFFVQEIYCPCTPPSP